MTDKPKRRRKPAPNQVVVALTPVVFAPLAGAISVWAAKHAGVKIDESSLQAVFIAGATIALAKAALWLKGWQEYEKHVMVPAGGAADVRRAPETTSAETRSVPPAEAPAGPDEAPIDDAEPIDDVSDLPEDGLDSLPEEDDDLDDFLDDDLSEDDEPVPAGVAG